MASVILLFVKCITVKKESRVLKKVVIDRNIEKYKDEIVKVSFGGYRKEMSILKVASERSAADYETFMKDKVSGMNGLVYLEDSKFNGYMLYYEWEEEDGVHCRIPEWGLGAEGENRDKVIGYLFQVLAEEKVKEKAIHFSVELYANDIKLQRLFSYMEFGTQAETGVCALENLEYLTETDVRVISKEELKKRWTEVWRLVEQLVNHLKKSPIFYFGEEFTEEVYKEFFMDETTTVYIAERTGEIVGLIQTNEDTLEPLFSEEEAANTADVYVLPEYRGTDVAKNLLFYALQELKENNYSYAWVEHGTANPNARYFWNKYFTTYKYEMVRRVWGRKDVESLLT